VFVVLAHARRRVVHFRITDRPSDVWVAQQIVEATPVLSRNSSALQTPRTAFGCQETLKPSPKALGS
jgi:hypothetical protein